jgi:type II secretory pathway component PulF
MINLNMFLEKRHMRFGPLCWRVFVLSVFIAFISYIMPKYEDLYSQMGANLSLMGKWNAMLSRLGEFYYLPLVLLVIVLMSLCLRLDYWGKYIAGKRLWKLLVVLTFILVAVQIVLSSISLSGMMFTTPGHLG